MLKSLCCGMNFRRVDEIAAEMRSDKEEFTKMGLNMSVGYFQQFHQAATLHREVRLAWNRVF